MKKKYYSYNDIHKTIAHMANDVLASGFDPDVIVAIGSGGFIPARIIRTFIYKPILTVGLSYYDGQNRTASSPSKIQWIDEAEKKIYQKRVLLVDEVDDTRATLSYCLTELLRHEPLEIAVCVLHKKIKPKLAEFPSVIQRVYVGEELNDVWVCYPWDAHDIEQHTACAQANAQN